MPKEETLQLKNPEVDLRKQQTDIGNRINSSNDKKENNETRKSETKEEIFKRLKELGNKYVQQVRFYQRNKKYTNNKYDKQILQNII